MNFAKKVAVAVSMDDDLLEHLKSIKQMSFLNHSEIHLVHVFNTISYAVGFAEAPMIYPIEDDRKAIEQAVLGRLAQVSQNILPADFKGKLVHKCLFHDNPKEKFSDYLHEIRADLAIVATRKRRGLFESSFAHYLSKHSESHLIVLKTNVED
jgi:hypothetical protein